MSGRAAFLRRPSPESLAWVAGVIGRGSRVRRVRALGGSTTSAVHAVYVERAGRRHALVLRRYLAPEVLAAEPDLIDRESAALAALQGSGVPAPRLLDVDPTAEHADAPAVLMTLVPGRVQVQPRDRDEWLRRMAALLRVVHAVNPVVAARYRRYNPTGVLPAWANRPLWQRALERARRGPDERVTPRFIHRDFHPGNVLWQRGCVTGVVDWVQACVGPPQVDIGHCRTNIAALFGIRAANVFLRACESLGYRYEPYWDVVCSLDRLPGGPSAESWQAFGMAAPAVRVMRGRLESLVGRAL
ncbi:MAG: aminoglycoside phosphotransferase family protein [Mycobacteriales bacterium]|nr:aminoglycoside phosphotransferase family protein [Frankia sp.]